MVITTVTACFSWYKLYSKT